jgi:hypothetical protein
MPLTNCFSARHNCTVHAKYVSLPHITLSLSTSAYIICRFFMSKNHSKANTRTLNHCVIIIERVTFATISPQIYSPPLQSAPVSCRSLYLKHYGARPTDRATLSPSLTAKRLGHLVNFMDTGLGKLLRKEQQQYCCHTSDRSSSYLYTPYSHTLCLVDIHSKTTSPRRLAMISSQTEKSSDERKQAVLHRQLFGLLNEGERKLNLATYATNLDKVILSFSSICAIIAGALNPIVPVRSNYSFTHSNDYHCSPCFPVGHIWPSRRCIQRFRGGICG